MRLYHRSPVATKIMREGFRDAEGYYGTSSHIGGSGSPTTSSMPTKAPSGTALSPSISRWP